MNTYKLLFFLGNLFKKSLENIIHTLKDRIHDRIEDSDISDVKELIKRIELVRKYQNNINEMLTTLKVDYPESEEFNEKSSISKDRLPFKSFTT